MKKVAGAVLVAYILYAGKETIKYIEKKKMQHKAKGMNEKMNELRARASQMEGVTELDFKIEELKTEIDKFISEYEI